MAQWSKNETSATKRRCDLLIVKNDNTLAPRGTDFIALGYVYISGVSSPDYALALGTMTNKRKPITFAAFSPTATDTAADTITKSAHGRETGDGPFLADTTVGGVAVLTMYWWIAVDANTLKIATSLANAYAGVAVDITASLNAVTFSAGGVGGLPCQRGVDGHFVYEAIQPETDHSVSETSVIVDGTDYERSLGFGGYTTVTMVASSSDYGAQAIEGARTRDDLLRLIARFCRAKFTKVGSLYTFRNLDDTKDSFWKEVTAAGCIDSDDVDLT